MLHQAAIPSVPRSVDDPVTSNRANVDGTLNLLVAARDAGVKPRRVRRVLVRLRQHADAAQARGHADRPLSPYALQKVVAEQYLQMFTALYGLETVTIRYFNVFGPRQDPSSPYSGVISLFATALLEGRPPTIYGDGEQTRDFTYVANVVDGVLRACEAPGASGEVINVATGGRISLNQLFDDDARASSARGRAGLRGGAGRRRARFAGRHHQGAPTARLRADGIARRGPAPDGRLVPRHAIRSHGLKSGSRKSSASGNQG